MIYTDDQEQTDRYWEALIADGGEEKACGWVNDKYGVSWQVTPRLMMEILAGDDAEGRERAFNAMLTMRKLIVADLQAAYDGV
jgi:predicted 3-demethylubiquinone-9 3-methyltransferase (glyoxalase superfamily)